ncbi:DotI/IcmL/TraM family protein [Legionella sp. km772]|uniref:DotI/IcmL/TraM family protein n=1 Tax=Legionella sp. km772 TaxID=2498111 RepID=UPI001315488E|nr:DotI/IcmL/TraM family protein [Legionella sp. km772]
MSKLIKFLNCLLISFILTTSPSYALPSSFCKSGNNSQLEDNTITFFANLSINSLFTFNFINYKELSNNSSLLSSNAWSDYNDYLNALNFLKKTIENKLVTASYFKINAKILSEDNNTWQVNVPFRVRSQSASSANTLDINATLTIEQNNKQPINCGLQITSIQFNPEVKSSFFKNLFGIGYISLPYQEATQQAQQEDIKDLTQPTMSDEAVITAANIWVLQNLNPSVLNGPLIITQKGILQNKYSWRIQINSSSSLLISRSVNSPLGLDFKLFN